MGLTQRIQRKALAYFFWHDWSGRRRGKSTQHSTDARRQGTQL